MRKIDPIPLRALELITRAGARGGRVLRLFALMAMLVACLAPTSASAQYCGPAQLPVLTATSMNVGNYNPFQATVPVIVTVTIQTTRACAISLTFFRNPVAGVMTSGASNLNYQIEAVGGGNSYLSLSGFVPAPANRIDIVTTSATTITRQVQVRVLPGQIVAAGAYSDINVTMVLISQNAGLWYLVKSTAVTPQATVVPACRLDAPSPSSIVFAASEIPGGIPNPAIVKNTTLTAACTAPALLRLTGSALTPTPAIPPAAGFDNFINYRAVGSFGAAGATLVTTTTTSTVTSPTRNVANGATTSGTVGVAVNLVAGQPIQAGSYSGVLTVVIDPTP